MVVSIRQVVRPANAVYTKVNVGFINITGFDNNIFASTRYNGSSNQVKMMQWDFPVSHGEYSVKLLFAEVWPGADAIGDRLFDVVVENEMILDDHDMTARYGWNTAGVEVFNVTVDSGTLDIDFLKVK